MGKGSGRYGMQGMTGGRGKVGRGGDVREG